MEQECSSRGKGIREHEIQFCVVGNDIKALYPSMKFENTGKIIRKRIEQAQLGVPHSRIQVELHLASWNLPDY